MHPVGTVLLFAGLIIPQHWMESKGVIQCKEVPKLCEVLEYYVHDNILTFPELWHPVIEVCNKWDWANQPTHCRKIEDQNKNIKYIIKVD